MTSILQGATVCSSFWRSLARCQARRSLLTQPMKTMPWMRDSEASSLAHTHEEYIAGCTCGGDAVTALLFSLSGLPVVACRSRPAAGVAGPTSAMSMPFRGGRFASTYRAAADVVATVLITALIRNSSRPAVVKSNPKPSLR